MRDLFFSGNSAQLSLKGFSMHSLTEICINFYFFSFSLFDYSGFLFQIDKENFDVQFYFKRKTEKPEICCF